MKEKVKVRKKPDRPPVPPPEVCAFCAHYDNPTDSPFDGTCNRYPPTLFMHPDGRVQSHWPEVRAENFCGEWEAEH